eukprot:scaffold242339_cov17-Prasinocladus_malaysianus.AAC.1
MQASKEHRPSVPYRQESTYGTCFSDCYLSWFRSFARCGLITVLIKYRTGTHTSLVSRDT